MGEKGNICRMLLGKKKGKGPLRGSRRGWVDNIKMNLRETGCGGMD
jgi:hypothetical protein